MNPGFQTLTVFSGVTFPSVNVTGNMNVGGALNVVGNTVTNSGLQNIGTFTNSSNILVGGEVFSNGIDNTGTLQNNGNITNTGNLTNSLNIINSGSLTNTGNLNLTGTLFGGAINANNLFLAAGAVVSNSVEANGFNRGGNSIINDFPSTAIVSYNGAYNYANPALVYLSRGSTNAGNLTIATLSCNIYGNNSTSYQLVDITGFTFPYAFNSSMLVADELTVTIQNGFIRASFANIRNISNVQQILALYVSTAGSQNTQTYGMQMIYTP